MDSTVTNAELVDRPVISHEDYLDLVAKRQVVLEKKSRKSDLQDYRDSLVKQMEEVDATLETIKDEIAADNTALQDRFAEVIQPLGITGEFSISDTEPHYVTEIVRAEEEVQ